MWLILSRAVFAIAMAAIIFIPTRKNKKIWGAFWILAAIPVFLIGVFYLTMNLQFETNLYTFQTPEKAYAYSHASSEMMYLFEGKECDFALGDQSEEVYAGVPYVELCYINRKDGKYAMASSQAMRKTQF